MDHYLHLAKLWSLGIKIWGYMSESGYTEFDYMEDWKMFLYTHYRFKLSFVVSGTQKLVDPRTVQEETVSRFWPIAPRLMDVSTNAEPSADNGRDPPPAWDDCARSGTTRCHTKSTAWYPRARKETRFSTQGQLYSRDLVCILFSALFGKLLKSKRKGRRCFWIPKFGVPNKKDTRSSVGSAAAAPWKPVLHVPGARREQRASLG